MKKCIALVLALVCVLGLVGCSSEMTFDIADASKIELRSGDGRPTVEITDKEDIKYITDNVNALKFSKGESSKYSGGWSYALRWYDSEGNSIQGLTVMSENKINYKSYFWTSMDADATIDIAFLDALLNN